MCRRKFGTSLAAVLALALFVASPFLITHHHHADAAEETSCPLCVFVSSLVAPAPAPCEAVSELPPVGLVQTADEISIPFLPARLVDERAPPAA